jgi:hypothetical protein
MALQESNPDEENFYVSFKKRAVDHTGRPCNGPAEAILIHPKTGVVHKSNIKVSAGKHTTALAKGAREISGGTVIYKQGGKLYMLQDNGNERSSQHFQDQFDVDY